MATITGTSGRDTLFGTNEGDLIQGLGGDDQLHDGLGADTLEGGDGDDTLTVIRVKKVRVGISEFDHVADAPDTYRGGDGSDTVTMVTFDELTPTGYSIDLGAGTGGNGDVFVSIENFSGAEQDDSITGSPVANTLQGRGGDDVIEGGGGADTLLGGAGDDVIDGGADADLIEGGGGGDTLRGGAGDDVLHGSSPVGGDLEDPDELHGGSGNDTLWSFSGVDSLFGDAGDDLFRVWVRNTSTYVSGGEGFDALDLSSSLKIDEIDWAAGKVFLADGSVIAFDGLEMIEGQARPDDPDPPGSDCIEGTAGSDSFLATAKAECFVGLEGRDMLLFSSSRAGVTVDLAKGVARGGHAKGDEFSGIENLTGSNSGDALRGDRFHNKLRGLDGDDTLDGRGGRDRLLGGDDADLLIGGGANDKLFGGAGRDTLMGGAGRDRLDGGGGVDTASWADAGGPVAVLRDHGAWRAFEKGLDSIVARDAETLASIENIVGSKFDDLIIGSKGDNTLDGGAGDDTLQAIDGDDVVFGGKGADRIHLGGAATTRAWGEKNGDTFVLTPDKRGGDHDIRIMDFEFHDPDDPDTTAAQRRNADRLDLSRFGFADHAEIIDRALSRGGSTNIELDDHTRLRLVGIDMDELLTFYDTLIDI